MKLISGQWLGLMPESRIPDSFKTAELAKTQICGYYDMVKVIFISTRITSHSIVEVVSLVCFNLKKIRPMYA